MFLEHLLTIISFFAFPIFCDLFWGREKFKEKLSNRTSCIEIIILTLCTFALFKAVFKILWMSEQVVS